MSKTLKSKIQSEFIDEFEFIKLSDYLTQGTQAKEIDSKQQDEDGNDANKFPVQQVRPYKICVYVQKHQHHGSIHFFFDLTGM